MQNVAMHHATKTMGNYTFIRKEGSNMLKIGQTNNANKEPPMGYDFSESGNDNDSSFIRVSFPNQDERPLYIMKIEYSGSP